MKNMYKRILFLLFIAFTFTACQKDDIIEPNSEVTFGIRHDKSLSDYEDIATRTSSEFPNFSAVIAFSYSLDGSDNEEFIASGTLIDKEWILTAGHNFYDENDQSSPALASGIKVKMGNDPNNPDAIYTVSELVFHPTWLAGNQNYDDANDLSLVKLSKPITNITPVSISSSNNEALGSIVWFCGFGDYSGIAGQNPDLDSKKHAIENTLDRKIDGFNTSFGGITYTGGLLAFDFDSPDGTINSLGDDIVNEEESYLGSGTSDAQALEFEGATVEGDSGGPLFVKNGSNWELAGVLSGGASDPIDNFVDSSYGDISIFTGVSSSYNWIISVIK